MFATAGPSLFNPSKKLNINASTPMIAAAGSSNSSSSNNPPMPTCKLFVGNLATHTTGAHLQAIFHSYGQVIECVKVRERYGFVRFANGDEAQRALLACNGIQLNGYPMIVEYAQNEILISPLSPRTTTTTTTTTTSTLNGNGTSAPFRPHPYHAGRSTMTYQSETKLTTPISINTSHHHHHHGYYSTMNNRDDIPLLAAAAPSSSSNKFASSTLNPDASSFTFSFSPGHHYHQTRVGNGGGGCSTSDYCSQSGMHSSGSSSLRSGSLSPSILSAISPSALLPFDSPPLHNSNDDERQHEQPQQPTECGRRTSSDKRHSTGSSLNLFIGDKILSLYGSTTHTIDTNNNHTSTGTTTWNGQQTPTMQFDGRDIDPRDPVFIWNFAFYPDVSISPFVKRGDIKALLERRVSLYSR